MLAPIWFLNHLYLAPVVPAAAAILCTLLHYFRILTIDLRVVLWIVPTLCLVVISAVAMSVSPMPLGDFVLITPQNLLLIALSIRIGWKHFTSDDYRAPSPWWVALIVVAGHLWTTMWIVALGG